MREESELLDFLTDEQPLTNEGGALPPPSSWRILIADDDLDVHLATRYALEKVVIQSRQLDLIFAASAREAREVLNSIPDIALVLLDVVMETATAGLDLVGYIRETVQNKTTRIVLRTGQPGYAPEFETIVNYDINDYRTKSDMSQLRLMTIVTSALRSYEQLCALESNRQGLERIVRANATFIATNGLQPFAGAVLNQIDSLVGGHCSGLLCVQGFPQGREHKILAAAGRFADKVNSSLTQLEDLAARELLSTALEGYRTVASPVGIALYIGEQDGLSMAAYIERANTVHPTDPQLLDTLCFSLSARLRNISLIEKLHDQAYTDALSGLPNRQHFIAQIDSATLACPAATALALIDIDDFASLNDLLGHAYADKLLLAYAMRLKGSFGAATRLARTGSNSFGVLGDPDMLTPEAVRATVMEPLQLDQTTQHISVSAGFVYLDTPRKTGEQLYLDASIALKNAKRHDRGRHAVFTTLMGQSARESAQLLSQLQAGFSRNELFLAYQPQIDLHSGAFVGLEALSRWRDAQGNMIAPDRFIPVAEQSGLILPMGEWVMETAAKDMVKLIALGLAPQRMAVNVSMVQFQRPDFVERVESALQTSGLPSHRLELEITESVSMLNPSILERTLKYLRTRDISISIDDFGTGYSSLSYLNLFPFDRLKIDRSFVLQMSKTPGPRIAEMIIQLGLTMGVRVIAEGIEDVDVQDKLARMGCHEGQGYHIGRPMELEPLLAWVRQRKHL